MAPNPLFATQLVCTFHNRADLVANWSASRRVDQPKTHHLMNFLGVRKHGTSSSSSSLVITTSKITTTNQPTDRPTKVSAIINQVQRRSSTKKRRGNQLRQKAEKLTGTSLSSFKFHCPLSRKLIKVLSLNHSITRTQLESRF